MNILIQGKNHTVISQFQIENSLSTGFYRLVWDTFKNLSLQKMHTPELPDKYVDIKKGNGEVILAAFKASKTNLGATFMGVKGTGKSVDAKKVAVDSGLPVIVIDKPVPRSIDLSSFLASIEQEVVVFIDEFGKNFRAFDDQESDYLTQESLLSILDGVDSQHKRLFVFTTNESLNEYMLNRPSRVKFLIHYNFLSIDEIKTLLVGALNKEEYLKDLLENLDNSNLTVDILFSIVDLINTIDKPYSEFKSIFNYVVSNVYEFTPVKKGEHFIAKVEGIIKRYCTVYVEGYGHYRISAEDTVKINGEEFSFKKTFSNMWKVF